ncbi:AraC family transcriptional regulator [Sinomicrobium kalidii]|uniref:AraC family transcriptional regulator n=1 Tax=Sinomicrobium kalidii TaxID=2900738 RepID=UPI001E4452AC|nr:AraC family transcriptional regulator [Sinomicrobium kalidii]UGU17445.1 AraC family transcriptional regulator [Sinomicrobium kalidii]
MRVLPFKIPKTKEESLIYQEDFEKVFYDKLHQHEEIQVSLIVSGEGSLIVGDSINQYKPGDVLVIGENLPHVFKSDNSADRYSFMITLFFTTASFGKDFFHLPEFGILEEFFRYSEYGFKVRTKKTALKNRFLKLKKANKYKRFQLFLDILRLLSKTKKQTLSTFIYQKNYTENEGKRMGDLFEYVMQNYDGVITLDTAADIASMSKNAFCRYFKQRTNKTFFQFLIEVRVENACKLLLKNRELSIADISDRCGFQNISNFNRKFKEIKGTTPSQYRKLQGR